MAVTEATKFTLTLNDEERESLLGILQASLVETHAERRRTESPRYQDQVAHEEAVLHGLREKVRALRT
jgi:hypothetical protein